MTQAEPKSAASWDWRPWLFDGLGLVLLGVLLTRYRSERPPATAEPGEPGGGASPDAPYSRSGALLAVSLRPVRAGLNMVTAVTDCEVTVTNEGSAVAEQVRVGLTLLAAHAGQQQALTAAEAAPLTRSVVPAFALQSGESRIVRGIAAANLDALTILQAGGREMLVPLVLLTAQHRDGAGVEHRTTQAFVIGVERVDSSKLAPFWLDSLRMVEQVAARRSGPANRRRL